MLSLGQLYTDNDTNDDAATDNDNTNDNDNDTRQTNHDCIGSLACMPNEPKSKPPFRPVSLCKPLCQNALHTAHHNSCYSKLTRSLWKLPSCFQKRVLFWGSIHTVTIMLSTSIIHKFKTFNTKLTEKAKFVHQCKHFPKMSNPPKFLEHPSPKRRNAAAKMFLVCLCLQREQHKQSIKCTSPQTSILSPIQTLQKLL